VKLYLLAIIVMALMTHGAAGLLTNIGVQTLIAYVLGFLLACLLMVSIGKIGKTRP
jgi:hypothetical protein